MADKTTELERVYTIPLRKTKDLVRSRRADLAVRDVKRFLTRHMKSEEIWLDGSVNEFLWSRGKFTIPSRIRVRATRFSDGVVEVTLPESDVTGSLRDQIKTRREKAAESPVLKAPTPEEAEEKAPGGDRPVTDVKGIGPATAEKLEKAEIATVADLAEADTADLVKAGISEEKAKEFIQAAKDLAAEGGEGKAEAAEDEPATKADEAADEGAEDEAKDEPRAADKGEPQPDEKKA